MDTVTKKASKSKKALVKTRKDRTQTLNLRQQAFLTKYMDPTSPTYSNAYQSALAVGFSKQYAASITRPNFGNAWISENIGNMTMLKKARQNLEEDLNLNVEEPVVTMFGPVINKETGEAVMKKNSKLIKNRQDATLFVLEKTDRVFKKQDPTIIQQTNIQVNNYDLSDEQKSKLAKLMYEPRST